MKVKLAILSLSFVLLIACLFFLHKPLPDAATTSTYVKVAPFKLSKGPGKESEEEEKLQQSKYNEERARQEFKMLRNPVTGKIPAGIRKLELVAASKIPYKHRLNSGLVSGIRGVFDVEGTTANNAYQSIGPSNIAGRSRTLAWDSRNPAIMLTGGPTGGIFRSTDGGANWRFVTPETDIRSATSIVQDATQPDTWYCGTGEAWFPISLQDVSNGTLGHGVFKSINNGVTWTKLTSTEGDVAVFDNPFDLVHRLAAQRGTGYVYAAVHRRIMRSRDKGQSWEQVLASPVTTTIAGGITEVVVSADGSKIFAAFSGSYSDRTMAGVWESSTGNSGSWTRIAGGVKGDADSVAAWRAYGSWDRVVLALNSATTKLFVLYKNDESSDGDDPQPEADLFRCDISSGNPDNYTWTNLKAYVPDEPDFDEPNLDPYSTYFNGFAMALAVKPDNDNILFIGGSMIHRVDLTKTLPAQKFRRIGGYGRGFLPNVVNEYTNHHPDVHGIYFVTGSTTLYTASDGGIHKTSTSAMADTVRWTPLVNGLQTVQYQTINISAAPEDLTVTGGTQDNGTLISNNPNSTDQFQLISGDGASSAVSTFTKTGTTWKQNYFASTVNGNVYRFGLNFTYSAGPPESLTFVDNTFANITPTGLGGEGQWITQLLNDPDSTEHLYYNSKNKLYRTTRASSVTASNWTQLTAVGTTVSESQDFTFMAVSKKINGNKYLFIGTDDGQVFRLSNPATATAATVPVNITPAAMLERCYVAGIAVNPRNPDTVIAVVSNYDAGSDEVPNIFWTGNATKVSPTWQVLDGALATLSSQSCEIVVKTTGVEYYVGTSAGLYSTTAINGNNTPWLNEAEGEGILRTALVRALKNRQRDNIMVVGTHGSGAFITEIGSPVVITDVITAIDEPITNDKKFISKVFPTVTTNKASYQTGNLFTVKKITVQVFDLKGQRVYQQDRIYQSGDVDLTGLARGQYVLVIYSDDRKYRHIQKLMRQ